LLDIVCFLIYVFPMVAVKNNLDLSGILSCDNAHNDFAVVHNSRLSIEKAIADHSVVAFFFVPFNLPYRFKGQNRGYKIKSGGYVLPLTTTDLIPSVWHCDQRKGCLCGLAGAYSVKHLSKCGKSQVITMKAGDMLNGCQAKFRLQGYTE